MVEAAAPEPRAAADGGALDVELRQVSKRFGQVTAVDGISLRVPRGTFVTLLGPSGCGKTTTLRMIAGFETPTSGAILIRGRDVSTVPPHRRDTGMVFQDYALFPHMTVAENVAFGLKMRRVPAPEIARRVAEALAMVGLEGYERRLPSQLSGGQRQRVALARALVVRPSVLLLDEPLGALDAQIRRQMQAELSALQKRLGLTFVSVTHDQEEALTMSDLIAIMRDGRVEQVGEPQEVYRRPATPFVATFLGECNLLPGRVRDVAGGRVVVEVAGVGVLQGTAAAESRFAPGERVQVAVRPEQLRMEPAGDPGAGGAGPRPWPDMGEAGPDELVLEGRVIGHQFAGSTSRHRVRVGEHELLVKLGGPTAGGPGAEGRVRIRWPFPSTVILPDR